jgi:hypothetical protein
MAEATLTDTELDAVSGGLNVGFFTAFHPAGAIQATHLVPADRMNAGSQAGEKHARLNFVSQVNGRPNVLASQVS